MGLIDINMMGLINMSEKSSLFGTGIFLRRGELGNSQNKFLHSKTRLKKKSRARGDEGRNLASVFCYPGPIFEIKKFHAQGNPPALPLPP